MSRFVPGLPPRRRTAPFCSGPLGSEAAIRPANSWAKWSTRTSNGCEERRAILLHYAKAGWCATYEHLSRLTTGCDARKPRDPHRTIRARTRGYTRLVAIIARPRV